MTEFSWAIPPVSIPEEKIACTYQADVVILGAGQAGTCAARAAAEGGASVLVLEQQPEEKQWILGVGEIGHINSRWQAAHHLPPVDVDEFINDWQLRTGNRSNVRLIRAYAQACGPCFDWFIDPLTPEERAKIHPMLTPPSPHFPSSLNGLRAWPGTANMGVELQNKVVKGNQALARSLGAQFFFSTRACRLEKKNGRVVGAIGRSESGEYVRFTARRGVILAAGDYSGNPEMCRDLLTESADLIDGGDWSGHGWDGSGIQMGVWAGGRLEPRSHAAMGGNYSFPGFDLIGSTAVLRVNCLGRRYSDEGFGTHILAALPGARQPNGMLWGVFDSRIGEQVTYQAPCHAVFDYTDPTRLRQLEEALAQARANRGQPTVTRDAAGYQRPLYCADTLEELAGLIFDKEGTRRTFLTEVARYNGLCHAGRDEDFGKDPHLLFPVERPPFYACGQLKDSNHPSGQSLKLLVTAGGLLTDEHQQVLGEGFTPIPGLYATGNCCGGRFGAQYTTSLPGQSLSMAQTMGRLVGQWLANITETVTDTI